MERYRENKEGGIDILSEISVGDLKRLLDQLEDDDFLITDDPWYIIRRGETEIGCVLARDEHLWFLDKPRPVRSFASAS